MEWVAISFSSAWNEKGKWNHSVMSNFSRPHGLQPTRLLHPWDFPGKSTGVGFHCLLQRGLRTGQKWQEQRFWPRGWRNIGAEGHWRCERDAWVWGLSLMGMNMPGMWPSVAEVGTGARNKLPGRKEPKDVTKIWTSGSFKQECSHLSRVLKMLGY